MSGSTTHLDTLSASQSAKETAANTLFNALSPAGTFGKRDSTTTGLTWGYFGGVVSVNGETAVVANGTVLLTGSTTNYVEAAIEGSPVTPQVFSVTGGFTAGRIPLYTVVTTSSGITSWIDRRALIMHGGEALLTGVRFPATQVASSNVNTFDDHQEFTWTPVLTCVTAGNLSVAYTTQVGQGSKHSKDVKLSWNILTSTFTHTTASGNLRITGSPYEVENVTGNVHVGTLRFSGFTKANYTQVVSVITASASNAIINAFTGGTGQADAAVVITDFPTGGTVRLNGTLIFPATS